MKFQDLISSGLLLIFNVAYFTSGQHVAPGVPPQHYQQAHIPQQQIPVQHIQQQHVPVQQQQMHMTQQQMQQQQQIQMQQQQQQMHMQQQPHVQQQPHMQQVPVQQQQMHHQQPHHPHAGGHPPQVLNVANIAQEKEHIAEHMSVPIDTSKMSEQELQFHYFKMHDADNNNKLDGCELIKSLIHWHAQGHSNPATGQKAVEEKLFKDEELVSLIDPIMALDDANRDGFIDYPEFVRAQQKAAAAGASPPNPQR